MANGGQPRVVPTDLQPGEELREIPGYSGYWASNKGRVWSCCSRSHQPKWRKIEAVVPPRRKKRTVPFVRLVAPEGGICKRAVNRLVANSFIPNPDNYPWVRPKDGDVTNCSAENLEWNSFSNSACRREGVQLPLHTTARGIRSRGWEAQIPETTKLDAEIEAAKKRRPFDRDLWEELCIKRLTKQYGLKPGNVVRYSPNCVKVEGGKYLTTFPGVLPSTHFDTPRWKRCGLPTGLYIAMFTGDAAQFYGDRIYWTDEPGRTLRRSAFYDENGAPVKERSGSEKPWLPVCRPRYEKIADRFEPTELRKLLVHPDDL